MSAKGKSDMEETLKDTTATEDNHVQVKGNEMTEMKIKMETAKTSEIKTFKVPSLKLRDPIREFTEGKEMKKEMKTSGNENNSVLIEQSKTFTKKTSLSPAEFLKQSEIPIPYKMPSWGGLCKQPYSFEVVKNGTVMDTIDLMKKSFYVFGRLPSCDISMEHPSLSRHHAVVQYCLNKSEKTDIGWYLYDLDSTHGTWLNKNKIKPRIYYRLRVGHLVKFGGSTRLHVLQGPGDDQDVESDLSVTEIKEQRERQKKEIELLKQAELSEIEENKKVLAKAAVDEGCSWGIDDDATEIDSNNPFALDQPQNEDLYIEDPKKSLRGYFEREGLDLPEYDVEDVGKGKYMCQVELPVYTAAGDPIIAEATVTGKKKDAVAACALEACRILDRMGELRKANHDSRKRKAKNWEENDFYDSDEDTFLDRTGDIERKRKIRMKKFGKTKETTAQTYDEIVSQLEQLEKEITEIQHKLDEAKAQAAAVEEEDGLDALDMFMANIKSGAMDTKTKMALKRRMFDLKQEQMKLQKLANVAKPANVPVISKKPKTDVKSLPVFGKIRKTSLQKTPQVPAKLSSNVLVTTEFKEEEEDDEDDKIDQSKDLCESRKQSDCVQKESNMKVLQSTLQDEQLKVDKVITDCEEKSSNSEETKNIKFKDNITEHIKEQDTAKKPVRKEKQRTGTKGVMLPTHQYIKHAKKKKNEDESIEENAAFDPDYIAWLPPEGQSGDGKTSLNEKYGY